MTTVVQPLADATQLVARKAGELDVLAPLLSTDYVVVTRDGVKLYRGQIGGLVSALGLGTAAMLAADTDPALSANSDLCVATQRAVRAFVDAAVTGLWDDRGGYDASGNTFPAAGGSGSAGAIKKGDIWTVSVAGTLGGVAVGVGDTVRALSDAPGQTATAWAVIEGNIGFVPLNKASNLADLASAPAARINLGMNGRATFSNVDVAIPATARYIAQIGTLSATRTATLPPANSVNPGQEIIVADESGSCGADKAIALAATGTDTIQCRPIRTPYSRRTLISDGVSRWFEDSGIVRCPIVTWTQLQALTGMQKGDRAWCTDVGVAGSEWIYNGSIWVPVSSVLVTHRKTGAVAAPLAVVGTGVTSGSFTLASGNPAFPAGLVLATSSINVKANFGKAGAGGTYTLNCKFGNNGNTSDFNALRQGGIAAGNGFSQDSDIRIQSATAWLSNTFGGRNITSVGNSSYTDRTASISLASPLYVSWDVSALNSDDAVSLLDFEIELRR